MLLLEATHLNIREIKTHNIDDSYRIYVVLGLLINIFVTQVKYAQFTSNSYITNLLLQCSLNNIYAVQQVTQSVSMSEFVQH